MRPTCNSPRRYLVTGGCGFIGSHLADALIAGGHRVVILDDLSTGKRENAPPQASLLIGDTTDYATVDRAFRDVDGCFHLAAIASVERSVIEWAKTHTVNVTSTVNMFQAASERNIPVVYTSSAAVYGDCPVIPIPETAPALPLTAYGADKLGGDLHGDVAWRVHGVPNIGLRPFNVYGPRQEPGSPYSGVISIFTDLLLRGQAITVHGDGKQVRDFVYVSDVVKAFAAAMEYLHSTKRPLGHDVINLCTGRATSINQLADILAAVAGCTMQRHYAPPRQGDIRVSVGDPARLTAQLGLRLDVTLREGLRAYFQTCKEHLMNEAFG